MVWHGIGWHGHDGVALEALEAVGRHDWMTGKGLDGGTCMAWDGVGQDSGVDISRELQEDGGGDAGRFPCISRPFWWLPLHSPRGRPFDGCRAVDRR